ncbi:unnamed protein product [Citrullus colocynthis]|uniref:Uncharacterized protein n=1 Tax=Citrullus colocynthis TaxID=252529 RepID=A0ABP0Y938_9ROSI
MNLMCNDNFDEVYILEKMKDDGMWLDSMDENCASSWHLDSKKDSSFHWILVIWKSERTCGKRPQTNYMICCIFIISQPFGSTAMQRNGRLHCMGKKMRS